MKQALIYKDEKSSKFWWIDYSNTDFVVNFGRTGSFGRFQLKEFESEEECEKEARKVINSKLKKGYKEDTNFDFTKCYYFDDEEYGLHTKTSHPNFVNLFKDSFYFDCSDEEAPFGSDEGADTLYELEGMIRKNKIIDWNLFPKKLIEESWEMEFILPTENLKIDQLKKQLTEKKDNEMNILQSDQVIIAVAFGQIKITGKINSEIKELALLSLKRIGLLAKVKDWAESSEINKQMISDLQSFRNK